MKIFRLKLCQQKIALNNRRKSETCSLSCGRASTGSVAWWPCLIYFYHFWKPATSTIYIFRKTISCDSKTISCQKSINRCITRQMNHSLFTTSTVNIKKRAKLNNPIISDILSKAQFGKCQEATRRSKPSAQWFQWFQLMMHPLQSCSTRRNF